jgi:DNA-binding winged helix-turn-helix (wHTH) protein
LTPLLRAVVRRDESVLQRLLGAGLSGALPELLGFTPGRRILVLAAENALVLEDHGNVVVRTNPPRWCPELLRLLNGKDVSKETLVAKLWGLRSYRAERHDPLLRTTIHRLRAFLEPYGKWVQVTPSGYGTSVPVVFVGASDADAAELELAGFEEDVAPLEGAPSFGVSSSAGSGSARERESAPSERIYAALTQLERASVRQLARAAEVSTSTALRALRELVRRKQVLRTGYARATRYRLPAVLAAPS